MNIINESGKSFLIFYKGSEISINVGPQGMQKLFLMVIKTDLDQYQITSVLLYRLIPLFSCFIDFL